MSLSRKKHLKRYVSLMLTAFMVMTMLSPALATKAYADDASIDITASNATEQLQIALNDFSVGVITLTGSGPFELTAALTVPFGREVAIKADSKLILNNLMGKRHIIVNGLLPAGSPATTTRITFENIVLEGLVPAPGTGYSGGIYFTNGSSSKTLVLDGAVVKDCIQPGTEGFGGGIYSSGNLVLKNSTITGNQANSGGGVCLYDTAGAGLVSLEIIGSTISDNVATDYDTDEDGGYYNGGGGVYSEGPLTITNSTITNNEAAAHGGGVLAYDNLEIGNSTITGNTVIYGDGPTIFSTKDTNAIKIDSSSTVADGAGDIVGGYRLPIAKPAGLKIGIVGAATDITNTVINYQGVGAFTGVRTGNIALTWDGNDADKYQVRVTWPDGTSNTNDQGGMWGGFYPYLTDLSRQGLFGTKGQGVYTYEVRTAKLVGSGTYTEYSDWSDPVTLTYDTEAPTVSEIIVNGSPIALDGSAVFSNTTDTTVTIKTTDDLAGVLRTYLGANGSYWAAKSVEANELTFVIPAGTFADGATSSFVGNVRDKALSDKSPAGNAASFNIKFAIDDVPTLTKVTFGAADTTYYKTDGQGVRLYFNASEDVKDVVVNLGGRTLPIAAKNGAAYGYDYAAHINVGSTIPEGELAITIDFKDLAGNPGTQVTTTTDNSKTIIDRTKPRITVVDPNKYYIPYGDSYIDKGYSATDNIDGDITADVILTIRYNDNGSWVVKTDVDTTLLGEWVIWYDVTDKAGNSADRKTRAFVVQGTITVKPIDAEKAYDGTALEADDYEIVSTIPTGDPLTGITFVEDAVSYSGSQIDVGSSSSAVDNLSLKDTKGYKVDKYKIVYTTGALTITPRLITATVSVTPKVYDGTTLVAPSAVKAALIGVLSGDASDVTLVNGTGTYADVNVGDDKVITFTNFTLTGTKAANYTLTQPSGNTATISPRPVIIQIDSRTEIFTGSPFAGDLTASGAGVTGDIDSGLVLGDSITNATISLDASDILAGYYTYGDGDGAQVATHNTYDASYFTISNIVGEVTSNYDIITVSDGTFTIAKNPSPTPFSVVQHNVNKQYDGQQASAYVEAPALLGTTTIEYFVNGVWTSVAPTGATASDSKRGIAYRVTNSNYTESVTGTLDLLITNPATTAPATPAGGGGAAAAAAGTGGGAAAQATAPTAPATTPAATTPPTTTVEDVSTPLAASPTDTQTIVDGDTPLVDGASGAWALLNLILAAFTAVMMVALLTAFFTGKGKGSPKKQGGVRLISIVFAIGAIVLFVLTQNVTLSMQAVDQITPWFAAIAVLQVGVALFAKKRDAAEKSA